MDYRKLCNLVEENFQKLEEKERLLNEKIKDLNKTIKPLEEKKALLSQQVELLKSKKNQMKEKINLEDYIIKSELLQTQQKYQRYGQTQRIKEFYDTIIGIILYQLEEDLKENLKCSSTETAMEVGDTRETYCVYGLLLSACELRNRNGPKLEIVTQVLTLHGNKEILRDNIEKAVILTKDMLTLVPPLLVTIVPQYDEKLYDTNRSTWDESGVNEGRKLTYYRPILVYGNQLHVAMKGLVGNTVAPQQQGQELKKDREQQQQPQHILAVQRQPDTHQRNVLLQHQQQPQHQAHHPHYNQQQQHPLHHATSAASFQATHPHVPKSSLHKNNMCVVCNRRVNHQDQYHCIGPDKAFVHRECYSCINCKGNHQLKLYYELFVCVEHINQIICKNCHKKGQMKYKDEVCFCTCQETMC
ncbi:PREDICTED: uncharacterized protein LOC109588611 isoform X2 [Amphimedon queenslandica]|uniref:LIM zinc-binding domain-containing protein n=2 Tax=Amphimedon queenslandica TaxID=400682 RepID=A0AAN0JTT9_AMPQE|nr:PREDICTED: uncharacterized protein LOC109588611 isoform X2 [Amphimedon queenslandica]|eukprot:XP_019860313.1 PREDICTED: uncharacterized protein LOC109588611 isoform X2 [Amphimedon queenslandica]